MDEAPSDAPGTRITVATLFDVRAFARTAHGSMRGDIDLERFVETPLSAEALDAIAYLRGLERGVVTHLRRLLVTATHKDARVTAFLTTWAFEKYWIADALTAVLEAHPGVVVGQTARTEGIVERLSPIGRSIAANAIGEELVAVHVTSGAVDELITSHAYDELDRLADHEELGRLIQTVRSIKIRHAEFFQQEARRRLSESVKAQAVSRLLLRRRSWPIGSDDLVSDVAETGRRILFGDDTMRVALLGIDRAIGLLPGLEALEIAWRLGTRSRYAHVRAGSAIGAAAAELRSGFTPRA